jgi:3-isopropylmalate/(R)-2-methylmalate dehydratase large subunit
MDHSVPTLHRSFPFEDPIAEKQVLALDKNCKDFGIKLFDLNIENQGIVHVLHMNRDLTLPGQTIVCGDSHTATHVHLGHLRSGLVQVKSNMSLLRKH